MKNRNNLFLEKKGFTLIEILVVVVIVSLAGVIALVNMGKGRIENNLKTAKREVVSTMKLAQSYALQGRTVSSGETPCGFGFIFTDDTHYQIFYIPSEAGMDCEAKNDSASYRKYLNSSDSPAFKEFELRDGVILKDGTDKNNTQIYFTVPHSDIFNYAGNSFGQTSFDLTNLSGKYSKTIEIDQRGSVSE